MPANIFRLIFACAALVLCFSSPANAHFGLVIPSTSTVMDKKDADIKFDIAFSHPSSGQGMDMEKPAAFSVFGNGQSANLLDSLKPATFMDHKAWTSSYRIARPGVYQFAVTPAPYFEPAEDCFIIHYAKTVVAAYGAESGWDKPLGLPVEIVPLTRPFGNFAGNVFQGRALKNGQPLAGAMVEIESLNRNPRREGPNDYYETQITRTDANGLFTVGIPWGGWWGFAVLSAGDSQLEFEGHKKDVELGGILWLQFAAPQVVR